MITEKRLNYTISGTFNNILDNNKNFIIAIKKIFKNFPDGNYDGKFNGLLLDLTKDDGVITLATIEGNSLQNTYDGTGEPEIGGGRGLPPIPEED